MMQAKASLSGESGAATLIEAMSSVDLRHHGGDAWFAGDASVVRAVRRHCQMDREMERRRPSMSGYWK